MSSINKRKPYAVIKHSLREARAHRIQSMLPTLEENVTEKGAKRALFGISDLVLGEGEKGSHQAYSSGMQSKLEER